MDVRPGGGHKHARCQAGVHVLQVQLGGARSAADYTQVEDDGHTHTHIIPDYCRLQWAHVHLGEFEEGIDVDVAVKHVHGGSR